MGIFKAIGKLFLVLEDSAASQNVPFTDEDFTRKLFPNGIWDLVIQLAAFVVLLVVVFFIAYKPVKKMVAKRREYVASQIASAEEANRVAQAAAAKFPKTTGRRVVKYSPPVRRTTFWRAGPA